MISSPYRSAKTTTPTKSEPEINSKRTQQNISNFAFGRQKSNTQVQKK